MNSFINGGAKYSTPSIHPTGTKQKTGPNLTVPPKKKRGRPPKPKPQDDKAPEVEDLGSDRSEADPSELNKDVPKLFLKLFTLKRAKVRRPNQVDQKITL